MTFAPTLPFARLATKAYADGYALHGEINLHPESFENRLRCIFETQVYGTERLVESFFENIHSGDLYITTACAQSSDLAWLRFETLFGQFIRDTARNIAHSAQNGSELASEVLAALFLPDRSGQSRIASFDGRQSLTAWLRIIISRREINRQALKWNSFECLDQAELLPDDSTTDRLNAAIRRSRYQAIADDCFREACNCLTELDRLIVLLRYDQGLRLDDIASSLAIGRSRVIRRLQTAQSRLNKNVVSVLSTKYRLGPAAIRECIAEMLENPAHSPFSFISEPLGKS